MDNKQYTALKDEIKLAMQDDIDMFFDNDENIVTLRFVRPNEVISYIEKKFGVQLDWEQDQNGWQHDYWITFKLDGQKYMLAGDSHYQDSCTLNIE